MGGVHSSVCRGDDYRTVSVWVGSLFGETDCASELNVHVLSEIIQLLHAGRQDKLLVHI